MNRLFRGDDAVSSIFALRGVDENDLSAAFAFALTVSERLRHFAIAHLGLPGIVRQAPPRISIQTGHHREGITDVELRYPGHLFVIFEAKRGSSYPSVRQLAQYARRCKRIGDRRSLLVALTSKDEAQTPVPRAWRRLGVPVKTLSWARILRLVALARRSEGGVRTRFVLGELAILLEEHVGQEKLYSNMVYVVSLANGRPRGWKIGWRDVVETHHRYFYPFGTKGWPSPPNYIAFRYNGRLQSIHHVSRYEVCPDLRRVFRDAGRSHRWAPHYLLHLGRAIRPARVVRTGKSVFRNARVWCMLDTLLTSKTISRALRETKRRKRIAERQETA